MEDWDDAAVYKITDDLAIILTLDFVTPMVDDPLTFGRVASANALSDVYAMGGDVILALNVSCFPEDLPPDIITDILKGGAEKVIEAGGVIAGGHTVDDKEPKYGLVVMGKINPDSVITNAGAMPGDILVLTKRLGVGIVTTVLKADEAKESHIDAAVDSMTKLNKKSSAIFKEVGINALTDITGFALFGHALEMARGSGVALRFYLDKLPFLPGSEEYADMWLFPAGTCNNQRAFEAEVRFDDDITEEMIQLLYTPETSGGLLASVPGGKLDILLSRFNDAGEDIWVVGEVVEGRGVELATTKK